LRIPRTDQPTFSAWLSAVAGQVRYLLVWFTSPLRSGGRSSIGEKSRGRPKWNLSRPRSPGEAGEE